ncbi:MAG: efflux RND transporter periplasmic adaptor subunit [Desulfuromonadales bacterium]|nr:efflux RND transporter periplasmic adaptor subunit [Desulfuromonadales bacterium]
MMIKRFSLLLIVLLLASLAPLLNSGDETAEHNHAPSLLGPSLALAEDEVEQILRYTCGMHPMIVTDEPGLCPICNMDLTPLKPATSGSGKSSKDKGEIKYWVAPMDPSYISDQPGKSPMGMDLVPVYEGDAASGEVIEIDAVTTQNMGVRTAAVEQRDVRRTIRTVGLVGYEEPKRYTVTAKVAGWIEKLYVDQLGQAVKQGQPLLDIYSPELVAAQEELLLALQQRNKSADSRFAAIADGAERLYQAAKSRLRLWDVSNAQIARLEQSGKTRKTLTLHAEHDGIVTMKMVNQGAYLKPGMTLFELSDISSVWVMADIYEFELPWVEVGQPARVILPFVGGKEIETKISYIYPYVEPKTRTVKARLEIPNPDFELKPDMFVNVRLDSRAEQNVLAVPNEAILRTGEKETLFVALGDGRFEPRQVKIGVQGDDGYTMIEQGVLAGERVVVSAQFMLDSESKLREAIQKMLNPSEPEPTTTSDAADSEDTFDDMFEDEKDTKKDDLDDMFD